MAKLRRSSSSVSVLGLSRVLCGVVLLSRWSAEGAPAAWTLTRGNDFRYTFDDYVAEFPDDKNKRSVFESNLKKIVDHNTDEGSSYSMGINFLTGQLPNYLLGVRNEYLLQDMLRHVPLSVRREMLKDGELNINETAEIQRLYATLLRNGEHLHTEGDEVQPTTFALAHDKNARLYPSELPKLDITNLPKHRDWLQHSSGVKNQGMCGSCWAISAISTIETYQKLAAGRVELMSVQQILDCMEKYFPKDGVDGVFVGLTQGDSANALHSKRLNQIERHKLALQNQKRLSAKLAGHSSGSSQSAGIRLRSKFRKEEEDASDDFLLSSSGRDRVRIYRSDELVPDLNSEEIEALIFAPPPPEPHGGCQGGATSWPYHILSKMRGIVSGNFYQYRSFFGEDFVGQCLVDDNLRFALTPNSQRGLRAEGRVVGMELLPSNSYEYTMWHIANHGPLHVVVDASLWGLYEQGIFDGCPTGLASTDELLQLNHAVVLEGYGTDERTGEDYWLVKNSWGGSWGENGYIRLPRYKPRDPRFCTKVTEILSSTKDGEVQPLKVERELCGACGIHYMQIYPIIGRAPEAVVLPHSSYDQDDFSLHM